MSLFDDYPDQPIRLRSGQSCCERAEDKPLIVQFLHVLGHSRVPFSDAALGALASIPTSAARIEVLAAIDDGWVTEVAPEDYMEGPTHLYIGCLERRR